MDSRNLTEEQARKMHDVLEPALAYLNKLMARMQKRYFDHDDNLWKRTSEARMSMQNLITELRAVAAQARKK